MTNWILSRLFFLYYSRAFLLRPSLKTIEQITALLWIFLYTAFQDWINDSQGCIKAAFVEGN